MPHDLIANLEALLTKGGDNAVLRLALASRYLDAGDAPAAVAPCRSCRAARSGVLGRLESPRRRVAAAGRHADALAAYERGIEVAEKRGDQQAAKEMRVFSSRLKRAAAEGLVTPRGPSVAALSDGRGRAARLLVAAAAEDCRPVNHVRTPK